MFVEGILQLSARFNPKAHASKACNVFFYTLTLKQAWGQGIEKATPCRWALGLSG